jgi:hypothetical protein
MGVVMMDPLPERFLEAIGSTVFGDQNITILAWSKTSITGEDADAYWTVITRISGKPNQYDEYMPHEVTISHVTRLIVFGPDAAPLVSKIISQDKEAYIQGTPNKVENEALKTRRLW